MGLVVTEPVGRSAVISNSKRPAKLVSWKSLSELVAFLDYSVADSADAPRLGILRSGGKSRYLKSKIEGR